MTKVLKKAVALLLCVLMVVSMTACGGGEAAPGGNAGSNGGQSGEVSGSPIARKEAVEITEPITIEFWHTSSGDLGTELDSQIKEFNETNPYDITVKGTYMGSYYQLLTKVKSSAGTSVLPDLIIAGAGGIEQLAEAGILADVAAYVERDNFDMENIPESLRYYTEYYEGQVIEFPYLVSTAIIYYNKEYYPDGFPTTIEEWVEQSKKITAENPGIYGMALPLDTGYIQRPLLKSLGAPGLTTNNGTEPASLDDGTLEQLMTDWGTWINDGHCMGLTVTDSTTNITNAFFAGKVAAFANSCAAMASYTETAKTAGIDMGYASEVAYGGIAGAIGGGGLAVLSTSTDPEIAACWEFIKFLYEDEQVIDTHKVSGYLPITYSAAESAEMQAFWEENPGNRVAFEQLDWATYNEWSPYLQEWRDEITMMFTSVLVDGSLSPADAIAQLRRRAVITFS